MSQAFREEKVRLRRVPLAALVAVCPALAWGDQPSAVLPRVGIVVWNLSGADARVIQKAEAECSRIFGADGIEIAWLNTAGRVDWHGPAVIFYAAIGTRIAGVRPDVFGTALPFRQNGLQLFIAYDRVQALSGLTRIPVHSVLAAALTHEIGHLLLRSREHSLSGIMRPEWGGKELKEVSCGLLRFTPEQRLQMQRFVLEAARQNESRASR